MTVKPSQSGARILLALEKIAQNQSLGVSELARLLETNIAAAQRAIATLADEGWIRPAPGRPTRWELTALVHTVAQYARGGHDLRQRARGPLEELWKKTGESVLLIVPDGKRFVVIDVFESPHYVRTAPPVGLAVPAGASATAWAIMPYLSPERQIEFLGGSPDAKMRSHYAETIGRGYAVSRGDVFAGSTNIAAPIFDAESRPVGCVLVSVPNDRSNAMEDARLGAMVVDTAARLSRGPAPRAEHASLMMS